MAIPSIGSPFKDALLFDINGKEHRLTTLTDKYLLLAFWSTTCFVCMKAAKELKDLHEKYNDKLNIVSINMDEQKSMWEQGTARDRITWANLSDGQGISAGVGKEYGIVSFPAYVLIDTDGTIINRWMGFKPGRLAEQCGL